MGQEGLLLTSVGRELEIGHWLEISWAIAWSISAISIESLANYNCLSNAVLQKVRLLSCRIWKEGLETMSIPCLALTGRHSQLLGCMKAPLRLLILLTFSSTFIHMWKEQWHCHCRLSHARGSCTKRFWGTKQHKTAGKMATSLLSLNLLGALMLEIKTLLPFCSGKHLVIIFWGVFCPNNFFF